MSNVDPRLIELFTQLGLWIESVSIRLAAQESVLKREFGITDEQWSQALAKAATQFPKPQHSPADSLAMLADLVKRSTVR